MKKVLFFACLVVITLSSSKAQLLPPHEHPLHEVNVQLRGIFAGLYKPGPNVKDYLYDMTAHITDDKFYTSISNDISETENWYKLYWEHYYSAYDTSSLLTDEEIFEDVLNMHPDTVPLGILDYDYYKLVPDALTTNNYFDFDTINDLLSDKALRPNEPYSINNIFTFAPLYSEARSRTVTFKIDMSTIFVDGENLKFYTQSNYQLYVNLDDGVGNRPVTPALVNYFTTTYTPLSEPILTFEIWEDGQLKKRSKSKFRRKSEWQSTPPPDESYEFEDLNVAIYKNCETPDAERKIVIYLSGIDIMDFYKRLGRDASEIYTEMLKEPKIAELRNFGYDFVVVDWKNSRKNLIYNALDLVKLIDKLKGEINNEQEFVILGESMGGLIARYALLFMESQQYLDPLNYPIANKRDRMHNTRLFITFDTPHQGANIPLSLQYFYKEVAKYIKFPGPIQFRFYANVFNLFLDGMAAKQMLIYHIDTKSGLSIYKDYDRHVHATNFINTLQAIGNYPQYCKLFAYSNGSLSGEKQLHPVTLAQRNPNDKLFSFSSELYCNVLGIQVPSWGANLDFRTNPSGNGQIFQANTGQWSIRVKFYWFGVKLISGYNSMYNNSEFANSLPYCVHSGGYEGRFKTFNDLLPEYRWGLSQNYYVLNLFGFNSYSDGVGCWTGSAHVGWNGIASVNFNLSLCSDGFYFNFVPVHSALDIPLTSVSLGHNYETNPTNTLSLTPFDVVCGNSNLDNNLRKISSSPVVYERNAYHIDVRYLINQAHLKSNFPYADCLSSNDKVYGHFFNREIGDEVLFLNNREQPHDVTYEAEYDILVNSIDPNYNNSTGPLPGVYSKTDNYIMSNSSINTTFRYDASAGTFTYNTPQTGTWQTTSTYGPICCIDYSAQNKMGPIATEKPKATAQYLNVYPNPTNNKQVVVNFMFDQGGEVEITIRDLAGRTIKTKQLDLDPRLNTSTVFELGDNFNSGIYIINVSNGHTLQTTKLVIL